MLEEEFPKFLRIAVFLFRIKIHPEDEDSTKTDVRASNVTPKFSPEKFRRY